MHADDLRAPGILAPDAPRRAAERSLEVRLFGHMDVRVDGRPLPHVRTRKGLWLLALLALRRGQEVDRAWLAAALWPDCDDASALRSLRQSLHDLRLALGTAAARVASPTPRTLRLDLADAAVDALAFDDAIAGGDAGSLEGAVSLYRGPLLEDCADAWCLPERQRREQAYAAALQRIAALSSATGDHAAAARSLRLAVDAAPFREDLRRALMEALARTGDVAGALEAYRGLKAFLWREMDAAPAEETTALFRRLRDELRERARSRTAAGAAAAGTPAGTGPRGRHLPVPLTDLIGRDEEVREVRFLLARSRLVTLLGAGGIGKTRLAIRAAEEAEPEFEDGAWFVALAAVADPKAVPAAVRDALGVPEGDGREEPTQTLRRGLSGRAALLVLDNCEHLSAACAALAEALLGDCPGLRILATSRQPLGTRGETTWRVPSLALPPPAAAATDRPPPAAAGQAPSPALFSAVRLFVERARAAESSFELTLNNAPAVVEVCRRLDGIPLAIELAAARARALSVEEIAARLRKGFTLLRGGGTAAPARHETLAAAFQWSWDLLSESERTLLAGLSVFAGGWTLAAAEAVCPGDDRDPDEVVDLLTGLVDRSLVVYAPAGAAADGGAARPAAGGARYYLQETVRQFAADRLRGRGGEEATRDRHRDFFLGWAEQVWPKLWGAEQGEWFDRLETEHDNLRAALEWCRQRGEGEKELRLTVALGRFWDTRGHLREGRARLEAAMSRMTPAMPATLRASAHTVVGWMADVQGEYAAAESHWREALVLSREAGDQKSVAGVLNFLACAAYQEGRLDEARARFEESLGTYERLAPPARPASLLNNIGEVALHQGDREAARTYFEECAAQCESAGSRQLHGLTLCNLALADLREGRLADAEAHNAAGLRLLHACGAVVDLCQALEQAAILACEKRQWERAARLFGAAEALREAVGVPAPLLSAPERRAALSAAREGVGPDAFAAAFSRGGAMPAGDAVADALGPGT